MMDFPPYMTLYLDFINIFLYVVRLLGLNSRRRD